MAVGKNVLPNPDAPGLASVKFSSTNDVEFSKKDRESVSFILGQLHESYRSGNYSNAVRFAQCAQDLINGISDRGFYHERVTVFSVLIEEAFFKKDYDKTLRLIHDMRHMKGAVVADTPCYRALRDLAQRLKDGSELMFFSAEELGRLRAWESTFLEEYLSFLAAWGYLHPIMLDPRTRNHHTFYYEDYFGLTNALPYRPIVRVWAKNSTWDTVYSNDESTRWCGRRCFASVNLDDCIAHAMNLKPEERYLRGIRLEVEPNINPSTVKARWLFDPNFRLTTNSVSHLEYHPKWKPGMKSPNTEENTVYVSRTNERVIGVPYIPCWVWIVFATLLCMAFAPSGERRSGASSERA